MSNINLHSGLLAPLKETSDRRRRERVVVNPEIVDAPFEERVGVLALADVAVVLREAGIEGDGGLGLGVFGFEGDELWIDRDGLLGNGEHFFLRLVVFELSEEVGGEGGLLFLGALRHRGLDGVSDDLGGAEADDGIRRHPQAEVAGVVLPALELRAERDGQLRATFVGDGFGKLKFRGLAGCQP